MDLFKQFLDERTYLKGVSPATIRYYTCVRHTFEPILAEPSKAGMLERVQKLLADGVSPVSVNTYLRGFKAYVRWLHAEGCLKEPLPIRFLKTEQKVLATLTPDQVKRIIQYTPEGVYDRRIHTFVLLVLDTGLRLTEALNLTRDAVDFDNLVIKVRGKGGKHRLVPFSLECRRVVFRYLSRHDEADFVFSTRTGTGLTERNTARDMKELGRKLRITGVRFSPHTLRHTFAVTFLRNGGDVYMLSRILGHSNITTTTVYLRSIGIDALAEAHQKFSPLVGVNRGRISSSDERRG
jgi:integrase/recombinase XerD